MLPFFVTIFNAFNFKSLLSHKSPKSLCFSLCIALLVGGPVYLSTHSIHLFSLVLFLHTTDALTQSTSFLLCLLTFHSSFPFSVIIFCSSNDLWTPLTPVESRSSSPSCFPRHNVFLSLQSILIRISINLKRSLKISYNTSCLHSPHPPTLPGSTTSLCT